MKRKPPILLWIAIALLPVRGLAAVLMPIAMGGMPPAAMTSMSAADAANAMADAVEAQM